MYFLMNKKTQEVSAHKNMSAASRKILSDHGLQVPKAINPVDFACERLGDSFVIYNLSSAFRAISESENGEAQALADALYKSVNEFYNNETK